MRQGWGVPIQCAICGGVDDGPINLAACQWIGARVVHKDPEHCREHLARQRRELDRQRATTEAAS